jgi:signal transduction histidine kinase
VREALTNAVDHGRARNVTLELRRRRKDVVLLVSDDGYGFDPTVATAGFGLVSMRERIEALGGVFRLRSEVGRGTEIEVTIR